MDNVLRESVTSFFGRSVSYGIICVTPENQHETWLNFEAGALAKAVKSANASAIPLLVGFRSFSDLDAPLSNYQAQMSTKSDLRKIVYALNNSLGSAARNTAQLDTAFEQWWPDLEVELQAAEQWTVAAPEPIMETTADKRMLTTSFKSRQTSLQVSPHVSR